MFLSSHQFAAERFAAVYRSGRWANAYLFVGPAGVGKRIFALELAKTLLCNDIRRDSFAPCAKCHSCRAFVDETHPDLVQVAKPEERASLPVDLLIGPADNRMKEGFCHELGTTPRLAPRKVALLADADYLGDEAANALLKTLEEPPRGAVIILLGTSEHRQLPTIRSRCQIVRFGSLIMEDVAQLLLRSGAADSAEAAQTMAASSQGSTLRAISLGQPEFLRFREETANALLHGEDAGALGTTVLSYVEAAGGEASEKRKRAKAVIEFAMDLHSENLRTSLLSTERMKALLVESPSVEAHVLAVERCMAAMGQVDRNAHLPTLIDAWVDDLCQLHLGKMPAPRDEY